ncbi:hypothetical protein MNBD_GAMMA12-1296 [hydrothermal vent metagenome]|uniref:Phytoene synthase n=1 Tax=hydrothermal vent metagenome TaxID=652676 RepID=A0A3B0XSS8_9ZZZZ
MPKNSNSDELLEKVLRPGSSFYYSTLHFNHQQRTLHAILFALFQEWMSLYDNSREPQVANTALHWWLQQIDHFSKCTTSDEPHPLLDRLAPLHKTTTLKTLICERMKSIVVTLIQNQHEHDTTESLNTFLKHTWGNLCVMSGLIPLDGNVSSEKLFDEKLANEQITEQASSARKSINRSEHSIKDQETHLAIQQQAGLLIGYYTLVKQLAGQLNAQRSPLPLAWLKAWEVTPTSLVSALQTTPKKASDSAQAIASKKIKTLLLTKIKSLLEQESITLESLLTQQTHYDLSCLTSLKVIRFESALLDLTIQQGFQIFDYRLQISPLKKFWLAWRCKYHYQKRRFRKIIANA